jgi:hypothetical protein
VIRPDVFARALVERLAAILPAGFTVAADGDRVRVEAPDGQGAATSLAHLDQEEAEPQDYADAAWNVLSLAQDVVSETAADPWPAALGPGSDLAEPGARVNGQTIHLYFGREDDPALHLAPIDVGPDGDA